MVINGSDLKFDCETQSAYLWVPALTHLASYTAHAHHKQSYQMANEQSL